MIYKNDLEYFILRQRVKFETGAKSERVKARERHMPSFERRYVNNLGKLDVNRLLLDRSCLGRHSKSAACEDCQLQHGLYSSVWAQRGKYPSCSAVHQIMRLHSPYVIALHLLSKRLSRHCNLLILFRVRRTSISTSFISAITFVKAGTTSCTTFLKLAWDDLRAGGIRTPNHRSGSCGF